jgi:hypothetical protein
MPVRDMTGLSGYYEFNLTWTPEDKVLAAPDNTSTAPDDHLHSFTGTAWAQTGAAKIPHPDRRRGSRRKGPGGELTRSHSLN